MHTFDPPLPPVRPANPLLPAPPLLAPPPSRVPQVPTTGFVMLTRLLEINDRVHLGELSTNPCLSTLPQPTTSPPCLSCLPNSKPLSLSLSPSPSPSLSLSPSPSPSLTRRTPA